MWAEVVDERALFLFGQTFWSGDWTTLSACCFRPLGWPMSCVLSTWAEPWHGSRSSRDPGFMNPTELLDIATSHALGEEAVRAIFNHSAKRKNKRQRREDTLMATADRKGSLKPMEGTPNHFKKLLEGPCSNHAFPVKHLYKD